ncbi:hypothetical protein ACQEU5_10020 [Marinactinospora thermotolerans]|uniref:Uncharacterized protein n=1 Tax=Marinactinospora thermotolerans DSM 45154 TaxID=1122192 RepID=A0A1T4N762_9ACTN|nr:hypothetical protein [Marinactinospora thermotolerans]SJZ74668.1 hypothetical protein SAMN02745673_01292 [Marinactinospora thermotolerans DSM 45154]
MYRFEEEDAGGDNPIVPVGFELRVPEGWTEFDLTGETLAERRAELTRQLAGRPEALEAVDDLFAQFRQLSRAATETGLVFAAGAFEKYEDGLFMANVAVFSFNPPPGEDVDLIRMVEEIHPAAGQRAEHTWLKTTTVQIPGAGVCGRIFGVAEHEMVPGVPTFQVVTHTAVNVPGMRKKLLISCASPNIDQVDPLLDLFDAITGTIVFWEDV